jgi:type IV pilus biogenesis protein CpaD/CtpE
MLKTLRNRLKHRNVEKMRNNLAAQLANPAPLVLLGFGLDSGRKIQTRKRVKGLVPVSECVKTQNGFQKLLTLCE